MTDIIKPISWSFSRLRDFERCKLAYKIKHLDKVPEPPRLLPPGKLEHANDRGSRIHDSAEQFVRGKGPFIPELKKFEPEFNQLRHFFLAGKVEMEENWAHDIDWEIADWSTGWLRLKVDAIVHASKHEAVIVDFKTGRKFGNEIFHASQLQLYALIGFLRYPELEVIHTEDWYVDVDELTSHKFTRDQALRFKRSFNKRGLAVTTNKNWPANPNKFSCRWCPYGPGGTGHCAVGVQK